MGKKKAKKKAEKLDGYSLPQEMLEKIQDELINIVEEVNHWNELDKDLKEIKSVLKKLFQKTQVDFCWPPIVSMAGLENQNKCEAWESSVDTLVEQAIAAAKEMEKEAPPKKASKEVQETFLARHGFVGSPLGGFVEALYQPDLEFRERKEEIEKEIKALENHLDEQKGSRIKVGNKTMSRGQGEKEIAELNETIEREEEIACGDGPGSILLRLEDSWPSKDGRFWYNMPLWKSFKSRAESISDAMAQASEQSEQEAVPAKISYHTSKIEELWKLRSENKLRSEHKKDRTNAWALREAIRANILKIKYYIKAFPQEYFEEMDNVASQFQSQLAKMWVKMRIWKRRLELDPPAAGARTKGKKRYKNTKEFIQKNCEEAFEGDPTEADLHVVSKWLHDLINPRDYKSKEKAKQFLMKEFCISRTIAENLLKINDQYHEGDLPYEKKPQGRKSD